MLKRYKIHYIVCMYVYKDDPTAEFLQLSTLLYSPCSTHILLHKITDSKIEVEHKSDEVRSD